MATLKFIEPSPYTLPSPPPPEEDYLYKLFQDNVEMKTDRVGEETINVALFGMGRAGTIHLPSLAYNPRVKILYIVEELQSKWQGLRDFWSLNHTTFLTSAQAHAVYEDPNVHAVIVTSPTDTHQDIVIKSLKAKKAVFCEKPIAHTREASAVCYEVARSVNRPLFVGFNRRFDPSYDTVRQRVLKGEVGHVRVIKVCSRNSPLPPLDYLETSGGIFHDLVVHAIDTVIWVLGEFPTQVAVYAHAHIPEIKAIDDHDIVVASMYFPSGTVAIIDASRFSNYGHDQRLEVFGPKGMITASNAQPIYNVETQYGLNGRNGTPIWYNFASRYYNAYQREMEHFLDIVQGKAESIVHHKEALAVDRIATACEESARTGKMVDIHWEPDEIPERD